MGSHWPNIRVSGRQVCRKAQQSVEDSDHIKICSKGAQGYVLTSVFDRRLRPRCHCVDFAASIVSSYFFSSLCFALNPCIWALMIPFVLLTEREILCATDAMPVCLLHVDCCRRRFDFLFLSFWLSLFLRFTLSPHLQDCTTLFKHFTLDSGFTVSP